MSNNLQKNLRNSYEIAMTKNNGETQVLGTLLRKHSANLMGGVIGYAPEIRLFFGIPAGPFDGKITRRGRKRVIEIYIGQNLVGTVQFSGVIAREPNDQI